MIITSKLNRLPTWGALLIWTTVSVMAYGLVGLMFHFPSGFPPNNGANFNAPALVVGALQGGFTGLLIGSLQALFLRQYFKGVRWWIGASVASLALTHAIGDALPDPVALPVVQVAGGIVLGIFQWFALRSQRLNAVVYIVAMGIAWFAGLTLGLTIMKQVASDWQTQHVIAGLITGIFLSVAAGASIMPFVSNASHEMNTPYFKLASPPNPPHPSRPQINSCVSLRPPA